MRLIISAAVLAALLAIGSARAAIDEDVTPPQLVYVEDKTGFEVYLDRDGCGFRMDEDAEDEEGGSGVHVVYLYLTKAGGDVGDYILHDYTQSDEGSEACVRKPGMWKIFGADLDDIAGNETHYSEQDLRDLGFFSTWWVYRLSHSENQAPKDIRKPARGRLSGSEQDLAADDDSFVTVEGNGQRPAIDWMVVYGQVPNGVETLSVNMRAKADRPCLHRLWVRNFNAGAWQLLDERELGVEEQSIVATPTGSPGSFITRANGPGFVRVRSTCEGAEPFTTLTDVLTIDWAA